MQYSPFPDIYSRIRYLTGNSFFVIIEQLFSCLNVHAGHNECMDILQSSAWVSATGYRVAFCPLSLVRSWETCTALALPFWHQQKGE